MNASPRSRSVLVLAALAGAASIAIVAVLTLGGGGGAHAGSAPAATAPTTSVAAFVPLGEYAERAPHVGSLLNITGIQGEVRGEPSVPPPDQPPLPASSFTRPVAEYLAYSRRQLTTLLAELGVLRNALGAGDRSVARADWQLAFERYLTLGAVYLEGPVSSLNQAIDGTPGGLPGGAASPRFTGLHRIEMGLWTGATLRSLIPYVTELDANVKALRALLPQVQIAPLDYATRAHEILEDAVRDLLSGAAVPWSGAGVLGTAAGLTATREVVATLKPLLHEPPAMTADPPANPRTPAVVDADLDVLASVLRALAAEHGGTLPSNSQLTQLQAERLDAAIGQALEGLAQLPGMLETTNPPSTPSIPRSAFRIAQ